MARRLDTRGTGVVVHPRKEHSGFYCCTVLHGFFRSSTLANEFSKGGMRLATRASTTAVNQSAAEKNPPKPDMS